MHKIFLISLFQASTGQLVLVLWSWQRRFLRVCIHNKIYTVYYIKGHYIRIYTQWRSWLRHCGTSRKVAGSFPDGIIGNFHWRNPSYGPGVDSASKRNEHQEYFLGGKGGRCVGLSTLLCQLSWNMGALTSWNLQAWSGPECSKKLRFPDFMTTAQDVNKVVSLTHRPPLPPGNAPGTYFC